MPRQVFGDGAVPRSCRSAKPGSDFGFAHAPRLCTRLCS